MLLVEVDRDSDSEGNGTLVDKLTAYRAWCRLPARYTAKKVPTKDQQHRVIDPFA
ncbi:hypothetical protein [Kitasatospora sp. NPDC005751]|uniref:hypothetical protein n=1 Tax=unclassified Kitasatospora TaxID=2633591 RepID=UPI0033F390E3